MSAIRIDKIFNWCDDHFLDGYFEDVDNKLASIDIKSLWTDEILAYLSITIAAKEHLPSRDEFYVKCRAELEGREEDDVDGLLRGLE